jgi:hypothetical protein
VQFVALEAERLAFPLGQAAGGAVGVDPASAHPACLSVLQRARKVLPVKHANVPLYAFFDGLRDRPLVEPDSIR